LKIYKTKEYTKNLKKEIINKHLSNELERVQNIENLILDSPNLKELILNPLSRVYNIEQKKGNLKEMFTARINQKMRLHIKPVGEYPYNMLEITEIELLKIDNKHYGDG
jgi:plasmid maintenance system killer protein